jgi:hypothetical protein
MIEQGSAEWFAERAGKITASRMSDVMALGEGGFFKSGPRKGQPKPPLKARSNYILQLACERLTGKPRDQINAKSLQWGNDVEPLARTSYEAKKGVLTTACSFVVHPDFSYIGASPDFLVGDIGGGEIKSPLTPEVHLDTWINGLPDEHIEQIQGGLWVTKRQWWDFVSYHPDFPQHRKLYIQRVTRDDAYIEQLTDACISLEMEVRDIVKAMGQ